MIRSGMVLPFSGQSSDSIQIQIMTSFGGPGFPFNKYASNVSGYPENSNKVENGGLFTQEECRNLARKIIQTYDGNGDGVCESIEVAKWLVDCYRAMNRIFSPTATDIASYVQIIDTNRNGKVTCAELEQFIIKYFHSASRVV